MWIWVVMWAVVELLFVAMLTKVQFENFFSSREGIWEFCKFIPVRFFLWPFLLVALLIEAIEAIRDINHLHVWWFDEDSFKL